jgi:hypothetical protein
MRSLLLILIISSGVFAQEPPIPTGRPSVLDRLESRVGVWDIDAKVWFSPDAQEFKGKGIERVQWSPNRQFLISDQWMLLPVGWLPKLVITSWDPLKNEYRQTNVLPNATYTTIMGLNKTGTVLSETKDRGHITRTWTTVEQVSSTETRERCECSVDGGPKWLFSETTSIKRKDADGAQEAKK